MIGPTSNVRMLFVKIIPTTANMMLIPNLLLLNVLPQNGASPLLTGKPYESNTVLTTAKNLNPLIVMINQPVSSTPFVAPHAMRLESTSTTTTAKNVLNSDVKSVPISSRLMAIIV